MQPHIVFAFDMGSVNYAAAAIAYRPARQPPRPRKRKRDAERPPQPPPIEAESVRLMSMRIFNLKAGGVTMAAFDAASDGGTETTVTVHPPVAYDSNATLPYLCRMVGVALKSWAYLAAHRDETSIESQVDHLIGGAVRTPENFGLACATLAAIPLVDELCGPEDAPGRPEITWTAKKQGVTRGLSYSENKAHKAKSVATAMALMREQHDEDALAFLTRLASTQHLKLDDVCDSYNMAVHKARKLYPTVTVNTADVERNY